MKHKTVDTCYELKYEAEDTSYIPVSEAIKVFKKDPSWVRSGIIGGWLPIGISTRAGKPITDVRDIGAKKGRINYYISLKKLAEFTGYKKK